jgi:hypothetical protein
MQDRRYDFRSFLRVMSAGTQGEAAFVASFQKRSRSDLSGMFLRDPDDESAE